MFQDIQPGRGSMQSMSLVLMDDAACCLLHTHTHTHTNLPLKSPPNPKNPFYVSAEVNMVIMERWRERESGGGR